MRAFFLIAIALSTFQIKAQKNSLSGTICMGQEGLIISYGQVSLLQNRLMVSADQYGFFVINTDLDLSQDTLMISAPGFISSKVPVSIVKEFNRTRFKLEPNLSISERADHLDADGIKQLNQGLKIPLIHKTIDFERGFLSVEYGEKIRLNSGNHVLNKLSVYLKNKGLDQVNVRIHFYDLNGDQPAITPSYSSEPIKLEVKDGWNTINLSARPLPLKSEGYIVCEYLPDPRHPKGLPLELGLSAGLRAVKRSGLSSQWESTQKLGVSQIFTIQDVRVQ